MSLDLMVSGSGFDHLPFGGTLKADDSSVRDVPSLVSMVYLEIFDWSGLWTTRVLVPLA